MLYSMYSNCLFPSFHRMRRRSNVMRSFWCLFTYGLHLQPS